MQTRETSWYDAGVSHYSYRIRPSSQGEKKSGIKAGYFFLLGLLIYSIIMTVAWRKARNSENTHVTTQRPQGLWMPITGAHIPDNPAFLPNAVRQYRQGINQGFDFYNKDAGIPISYGTPVVAVADGVLERVDSRYTELTKDAWDALMFEVEANGTTSEQLDRLRGRQVWLRIRDPEAGGWLVRYGHLAGIAPNLQLGQTVYQGQVLGYVGNSGTGNGVAGNTNGSRLHFEIWKNERDFWGRNLNSDEVRRQSEQLFVNP